MNFLGDFAVDEAGKFLYESEFNKVSAAFKFTSLVKNIKNAGSKSC